MTEVTQETFQSEVLESARPVLVDFYAPWCQPCQKMVPILESIWLEDLGATLKIVKCNIEKLSPEIMNKYNIYALPTLIIFHKGQPIKALVGIHTQEQLTGEIDECFQ